MEQVTKAIDRGIAQFTEKYELDAEIVSVLRTLLHESCATCVVALPKAVASDAGSAKTKAKSGRRKTGYNCYIKTQFAKAKENAADVECNSQELMTRYSKEWQTLDEAAKQPYLDQASVINAESTETSPVAVRATAEKKGPKKLSGYNVFYRDNKDDIKSKLATGEKLMTKVGAEWKSLTEEQKAVYNTKAKETEVVSA
jgi:hypothetical protein